MEGTAYETVFRPPELESFYQDSYDITLKIWKEGTTFELLSLGTLPAFYTVEDIKRALYVSKRSPEFYPRFVFLGEPLDPSKEPTASTKYQAADYIFKELETEDKRALNLLSPLALFSLTDKRFVDKTTGQWRPKEINKRDRTCLEKQYPATANLIFHVFTLDRLLNAFTQARGILNSISEADWNGRFGMFFPDVSIEGPFEATAEDKKEGAAIIEYFNRRNQRIEDLEGLITLPMPPVKVKGIQRLRLTWNPPEGSEGPEMLFYRLPVTHRRPFMRLITARGQPVNKIHTLDDFYPPRPDIEDPNFLKQWANEVSPKLATDFLFSKILLRELRSGQKPLYATQRIFEDGGSDIIVQPLKQERVLDVDIHLGDFSEKLEENLEGTPYTMESMDLGDVSAIYQIKVDDEDPKLTRRDLERRLPCFAPFLQLTPAYTSELPQMMVRYKAVSQYTVQNQVITYINHLAERDRIRGDGVPAGWIPKVAEEFQMTNKEAHDTIVAYLNDKSQFVIVNPTMDDIMEGKNPGIDIAIFEQHPVYSLHVFGVNSAKHIPRILMLMRMLITLPASDLPDCSMKATERFQAAEATLAAERNPPPLPMKALTLGGKLLAPLAEPTFGTAASASYGGAGASRENAYNMGLNANAEDDEFGLNADLLEGLEADEDLSAADGAPEEGPGSVGASLARGAGAAAPEEEEEEEGSASAEAAEEPDFTTEELAGKKSRDAPILSKWVIALLKKADPTLFDYPTSKGVSGYSRKCGATTDSQPIVMNRQQFERNYKLYQDKIIVFPIRGTSGPPPVIDDKQEIFMFTRYGTGADKDYFYTCPPIFCLRDFLIIQRDEFKSRKARDGGNKDPFTCPFCRGTVINDRKKGTINATVYVRMAKAKAPLKFDGRDETFRYIGFMKRGDHPSGKYFLPCCYLKPPISGKKFKLTADNEIFQEQTDWLRRGLLRRIEDEEVGGAGEGESEEADAEMEATEFQPTTEEEAALVAEEEAAEASVAGTYIQSEYQLTTKPRPFLLTLNNLHNEYIQSYEKSLLHGKVALLSPALNAYFEQQSADMVKTIASRQMLVPTAKGILRVGVGNTNRNRPDSLLAALAPLLGRTVISEVKDMIRTVITPRVFVHANYGNLVHEYFNPNDPEPKGAMVMEDFASKHLGIDNKSENRMAVSRFYRSYMRFLSDLDNPMETKQLRVFGELLQIPGLFLSGGRSLLLIVIEADFDDAMRPVRVLCPAYGVNPHARDNADIAFIVRYITKDPKTGEETQPFYDPLLWTQNYPGTTTKGEIHQHWFVFQRAIEQSWPQQIKGRIKAFLNQCDGPGRMPYASQTGPDPYAMISISQLREFLGKGMPELMGKTKQPSGILRDSYNHVAALLYQVGGKDRYITVPVVDDGYIYPEILYVELDWEGYEPATVDEIISFYNNYVRFRFSALYPGYFPKFQVKSATEDRVIAIQLENGLFIPAQPAKKPVDLPVSPSRGTEFEWRINKKLVEENEVPFETPDAIDMKFVNELYEHFRLSFANWVVKPETDVTRQSINEIVTNDALPLNEKRKRLDILLRATLERWLDVDSEREITEFEILRKDCISIEPESKGKCTGTCRWLDEGPVTGKGRCRIHVPAEAGNKRINTTLLFTQRLYDELIRIPFKRTELMSQGVGKLKIPTGAVLIGDQWILPDSSAQWVELKRLEWAIETFDKPRFFEEMSREPDAEAAPFLRRPSDELAEFLGAGTEKLYIWTPPANDTSRREPYIAFAPVLNFAFSDSKIGLPRDSAIMTQEAATEGAKRAGKILVFANLTRNSIIVGRPLPSQPVKGYIVFVEQEGVLPSLLVSGPKSAALIFDAIPEVLKGAIKRSAPVFKKAGVPVAASAAAAAPVVASAAAAPAPPPTVRRTMPVFKTKTGETVGSAAAAPAPLKNPFNNISSEGEEEVEAAPAAAAPAPPPTVRRTMPVFKTKAESIAAATAGEAAPAPVKNPFNNISSEGEEEVEAAPAAAAPAPPPTVRRTMPVFKTKTGETVGSAAAAPATAPANPFNIF
jgi:hypothetical protein